MNPKDMTNYDLVSKGLWATFSNGVNDGRGRKRSAEHTELTDVLDVELLRRLDERDQYKSQWENCNSDYRFAVAEADALRKENEELRKESFALYARLNEYSYQFIYGGMSGVETAYVLAAPVLASYSFSHPDRFDAKESEASHAN